MTGWVILVDQPKDFPNAETPHKVITTSEYLARPRLFEMGRPKLVNLARSYAYQSKGYYASLLAEARGHRVVPSVETMLELREAKLYEHALPELEDELNRCARRADFQPEGELRLLVCFGLVRWRPAALVLLAVAGWADVISAVFRNTILQLNVPDALRGRLMGVQMAVVTGGPRIGDAESGAVAAAFSAPRAALISAT